VRLDEDGLAQMSTSNLSVGPHRIEAEFVPDDSTKTNPSQSSPLTVTVTNPPPPNVHNQLNVTHGAFYSQTFSNQFREVITLTNTSGQAIQGMLSLVLDNLG